MHATSEFPYRAPSQMVKDEAIRGIERGEIRQGVDAKEVATLIISSLEGALVIGRLERNREALVAARSHLERYPETEVRRSARKRLPMS